MKIFTKLIICIGALVIASILFPESVYFRGGALTLAAAGVILWLANLTVRPLLQVISFPITLISLGLFSLVVNAWIVALTDTLLPSMKVTNFWLCLFIALLISAGNTALSVSRMKRV